MHRQIAGKLTSPKTKWVVLVFWIIVVAVASMGASKLTGAEKNDQSSWVPGSAESTKAAAKLEAFQSPNLIPTVVLYHNEDGFTAADMAKAKADAVKFASVDNVSGKVQGPALSPDKQVIQTVVPLDVGSNGWEKMPDLADDLRSIAQDGASDGTSVFIAGPGGVAADSADAFAGIDGILLFATIGVVIIILLITYRSPVLWLFPVISAGVALTVAEGVIYLLAKGGLTVNAQSAGILTVLVFGAGTDYALLLVARYREELRRHHDKHEAMAVALHRAGPAIFASGGTVIVGMLCLTFAQMNSTKGLGPVAAVGIAVGLAVMLTLLPALLVIFPRGIFWPAIPHEGSEEPTANGFWARIGRRIAVRPRTVWVVTALILAGFGVAATSLNAKGLNNENQFTKTMESVTGAQILADHGLTDDSQPVAIMANADQADAVVAAAQDVPGIASVDPPIVANGVAYIPANLADAPDSQAAFDTIDRVRDAVHAVPDADALVGGQTAIVLDINRAASQDNKVIIPIILLVVFLILSLLLRALLVSVILIATVVLSYLTTLGVSALVFHHVFDFGGSDSAFPLFVFVFLVALGIDYNIFLMTRVREEALVVGTRRGALIGLSATGGVITSAGIVLAGTFAVLASLPLVFLAELGFAVAFGVLMDTIIVRSVLVTAINLDVGRHIWWPSALAKKEDVDYDISNIEAEGSTLVS